MDERRPDRLMLMWAGAAFGGLYLILVFIAGILTETSTAWHLAIFTAGMAYTCTAANAWETRGSPWRLASSLYVVTFISGTASGVLLLFR